MPVFKKILDGPDAKETEVIKTSSRIREVPSSGEQIYCCLLADKRSEKCPRLNRETRYEKTPKKQHLPLNENARLHICQNPYAQRWAKKVRQ
jgi:hypothetical protein